MATAQPTLDDIWQLFRETDRKFQETDLKFQETSRSFQETDRKFQETDRKFKETDLKFQETSRQFQETDRKFQETDRKIDKVTEAINKLGSRLGDFIEDAVRPASVRLFRERGIEVHEVHQNISAQRGQEGLEVDLLVVDDADVVAIECKSNLSLDDIKDHVERLAKLKRLLPKYAGSRVLGAVAAMVIPDNVAKYAYRQGLYVIGQSGDQLVIRNDASFTPKAW
jgi:hypothetical protein